MKKSTTSSKVTLTKVRKILKETVFNPKNPGPWKIILDVDDETYFIQRAMELIKRAESGENKEKNLRLATQLLVLARAYGELSTEEE